MINLFVFMLYNTVIISIIMLLAGVTYTVPIESQISIWFILPLLPVFIIFFIGSTVSGFFAYSIKVTEVLGFMKDFSILLKFFRYYYPVFSLLFTMLSVSFAGYTYLTPSFVPCFSFFCFCVIGVLLNLTLLLFNYVTNSTYRNILIVLTIILIAIIISIIAYFSFRLVKDLLDYVLKMESSQQPGNNSGNNNNSPNTGSSNGGPSNNGGGNNNNNDHGVTPDDRKEKNKAYLKQRLEGFIPQARQDKIDAGKNPDSLTYGDLRNASEKCPRPLTWSDIDLLKEVLRDAGRTTDFLRTSAYSQSDRARHTVDRIF